MNALTRLAAGSALLLCVATACGPDDGDRAMGMGDGMGDGIDAAAPGTAEQAVHSVCPSGATVFGIDVSKWQGTINWASVAGDGVKFAFIRVSDGTGYIDEKFAANWSGARSHGIKRGAYQFFRSNQDPIAQANILINRMGALQPGDLPPVVDVESTDGVSNAVRAQKLHQWLDRVEAATGVKPIIYTGGYFWDDHVGQSFSAYKLWHAGYTGGTCPSTVSNKWSTWTFWQYSSSGRVAGISGNVDVNRFNGSMSQLNALGVDPCVPHDETCNGADDNCDGVADEGATCSARDEAIYGAAWFDAPGNADVDGDGISDVCARASAGALCALSGGGEPIATLLTTTSFSNANGWDDVTNYATLRLADVTGDGLADLCARGNSGLVCKPSTGSGFGANIAGPAFADASNWNKPEYYSTIRIADVDGDGKSDACARAGAGFRCHLSNGAGFGDGVAGGFWTNDDGFTDPGHYGTVRMADIDGDGRADACARTRAGVECHRFVDGAWGPALTGPAWSDAAGFNKVQHWSTLRFADLNGDHKDDVCIRAADGIHCRLSTGDGFATTDIVGPGLADTNGWSGADNYPTLRFADVTGDGLADLCGRGNNGARCWPFSPEGHFLPAIVGPDYFADAAGFNKAEQFRTIRVADVDGDARADLCGRDAEGFSCFLSNGHGFDARVDGPRWASAQGWSALKYSGTFMMSGYLRCRPMPETCDGMDNDCNGVLDDAGVCQIDSGVQVDDEAAGPDGPGGDSGDRLTDPDDVDADAPGDAGLSAGCGATPSPPLFALGVVVLAVRRRRAIRG